MSFVTGCEREKETNPKAGRDTGVVRGLAGLCEGIDVERGELCDDGELELCGEGVPGSHWRKEREGWACI